MASSTIPALKAALHSRLLADGGLDGVTVSYGVPFGSLPRELVLLGNARADDPTGGRPGGQSSAAMGAQRREERYALELLVSVIKPAEQQTVTERAFAIADQIEDSVRAWGAAAAAFGGVVRWALVTATSLEELVAPNGSERQAIVSVDVACAARI